MALDESGVGAPGADKRGAGGTPGGIGEFFVGLAMAAGGGYLLMQQVTVTSGYWTLWGYTAFGFSLASGALVILLGIITNLTIFFRPTSLFNTLIILALLAGGLGLIARSVRTRA